MTAFNVVNRASMVAGQPEDISPVLANFDALAALLNGNLDNSNFNAAGALALSKLAGYPTDGTKFARGDGTWAAPSGGAMSLIADYTVVGAGIPTFDTNIAAICNGNIPQTYKSLLIHVKVATAGAASNVNSTFTCNNDTAGAYYFQRQNVINGVASADTFNGTTSIQGMDAPGTTSPLSVAYHTIQIPHYTMADRHVIISEGFNVGDAAASTVSRRVHGYYNSAAAITRFALTYGGNNINIGSRITVWGLN